MGTASWYSDGTSGIYGALPGYVDGSNVVVTVCRGSRCERVPVRTQCACFVHTKHPVMIDLSPEAFAYLAPLSVGLVEVTMR